MASYTNLSESKELVLIIVPMQAPISAIRGEMQSHWASPSREQTVNHPKKCWHTIKYFNPSRFCLKNRAVIVHCYFFHQSPFSEQENPTLPDFTEACLGCICDATTACNLTIGCTAGLCGPFLIGRQYWIDAGAPVLAGDSWHRNGGK